MTYIETINYATVSVNWKFQGYSTDDSMRFNSFSIDDNKTVDDHRMLILTRITFNINSFYLIKYQVNKSLLTPCVSNNGQLIIPIPYSLFIHRYTVLITYPKVCFTKIYSSWFVANRVGSRLQYNSHVY